jgi:hypothetical protein
LLLRPQLTQGAGGNNVDEAGALGASAQEEFGGCHQDQRQTNHGMGEGSQGETYAGCRAIRAQAAHVLFWLIFPQFSGDSLRRDSYGNASFDEVTKSTVYDSTKVPNAKEKDERSRQKSLVFSKLLEALNSEEIEGQKSRKESVQTAVQGLIRVLERSTANEAEKESMIGASLLILLYMICIYTLCILYICHTYFYAYIYIYIYMPFSTHFLLDHQDFYHHTNFVLKF